MLLRLWLVLLLAAVLPILAEEPAHVPAPVLEYRSRIADPLVLAREVIFATRAQLQQDRLNYSTAREEVAYDAMEKESELTARLESALASAQARVDKNGQDPHMRAAALEEQSQLLLALGKSESAAEAGHRGLEILATAETKPAEFFAASLKLTRTLYRAGKKDAAIEMFRLAQGMVKGSGPLQGSTQSEASLEATRLWLAMREKALPADPRAENMARADAVKLIGETLAKLESSFGASDAEVIDALADSLMSLPFFSSREDTENGKIMEWIDRLLAARPGAAKPSTLRVVSRSGVLTFTADNRSKIYEYQVAALAEWLKGAGIQRPDRLNLAVRIFAWHRDSGRYAEAEELSREMVKASTALHGPEHRETLRNRNYYAIILATRGKFAEAEKESREIKDLRVKAFGADDIDTLGSMNNVAVYVQRQGRFREAEKLHREALDARVRVQGQSNRETLRTKANLAGLLVETGDIQTGETMLRDVYKIRLEQLGAENVDTLSTLEEIAEVELLKGDTEAAMGHARQVMEARKRTNGETHPLTAQALSLLGDVYLAKGDRTNALENHYRAVSSIESRYDAEELALMAVRRGLGNALCEAGDYAGAEPLLKKVAELYEKKLGRDHPDAVECAVDYAILLSRKGDTAAAESMLRRGLERGTEVFNGEHPFVARCANALADLLARTNREKEAAPLALQASKVASEKLPGNKRLRALYDELSAKLGSATQR